MESTIVMRTTSYAESWDRIADTFHKIEVQYDDVDYRTSELFQWSYPLRKQQLKEFLDKNSSHPADDYCVQFDFFIWEITEGDYSDEWKKFLNSGSLEIGVDVFFNEIEQGSIEGPRKEIAEEIRSWYEMTFN